MAKLLYGSELAGFIKERQAKQVRALRQAHHTFPRLAIIKSVTASEVIDVYVRMKRRYGDDILIDTVVKTVDDDAMPAVIARHNDDPLTHGIIVQLPITDPSRTDEIVNIVASGKDVDGLGQQARFDSATALAIDWLLSGYGINLAGKRLAIVGNGRLVGAPLARRWQASGYDVTVLDDQSDNIAGILRASQVIVTATGTPRLITSDMVGVGAVVVDAGTASESGVIVGDVDDSVRERDDIIITPQKGGVGPLTIAALYDNVIQAALAAAGKS